VTDSIDVAVDAGAVGKPFAHHWRTCVGAGRVAEALRADFQHHLEMVQRDIPFQYLRAHGLFHEDMMVYREEGGQPVFNWQYVDLVYDHWLSCAIRPFVELSFMPYGLASGTDTVFWWKANITPPRDHTLWELLVERFLHHVIDRYGIVEVRRWYFEVWNEPNLAVFWRNADFEAYMQLYERTARVLKCIDAGLRVGGPASAGSGPYPGVPPWGSEFLAACRDRSLPLDFFSTHPYPTEHPVDLESKGYMIWGGPDRLLVDLEGARAVLDRAGYRALERHCTEWSSSPSPRDISHDTAYMAPFIVRNNWLARGLADSLSYWTVSDIFEEGRLGDTPFHGGFGLVNIQGLKKPSYHGYWFLSRLGEEELGDGESYAVTRRADGSLAILLWNYCHYDGAHNDSRAIDRAQGARVYDLFEQQPARQFLLRCSGLDGTLRMQTTRFDRDHGSVYDAWLDMGAPSHIRPPDLAALKVAMVPEISVQRTHPHDGILVRPCVVEPHGVTLLEISKE
jgi:xylan 1,4-beta-xylosidase